MFALQDVVLHPSDCLFAAGLIDGSVLVHAFGGEGAGRLHHAKLHTDSCRAAIFQTGTHHVITGSADRSLRTLDVVTGKELGAVTDAHDTAVTRLVAVDENCWVSGAWQTAGRGG